MHAQAGGRDAAEEASALARQVAQAAGPVRSRLPVGPLPVRYAAGCSFVDHCKLEELPDSICELSLASLCAPPYCRAPFCAWPALAKASTAAEPHVRCSDVSHNELRALPGCLDTTNLTTMCAPRPLRPDCVAHGVMARRWLQQGRVQQAARRAAQDAPGSAVPVRPAAPAGPLPRWAGPGTSSDDYYDLILNMRSVVLGAL